MGNPCDPEGREGERTARFMEQPIRVYGPLNPINSTSICGRKLQAWYAMAPVYYKALLLLYIARLSQPPTCQLPSPCSSYPLKGDILPFPPV